MAELITTTEAAGILGKSQRTTARYVKDGLIPFKRQVGRGMYLLDRAQVERVARQLKAEAQASNG